MNTVKIEAFDHYDSKHNLNDVTDHPLDYKDYPNKGKEYNHSDSRRRRRTQKQ